MLKSRIEKIENKTIGKQLRAAVVFGERILEMPKDEILPCLSKNRKELENHLPFMIEKQLNEICLKIGIQEKDIYSMTIEEKEVYLEELRRKEFELTGIVGNEESESFQGLSREEKEEKLAECSREMIRLALNIYQPEIVIYSI